MAQRLHTSYAWLHRRYVHEHKTIEDMAKEAKVVPMTIRRALQANGLISK